MPKQVNAIHAEDAEEELKEMVFPGSKIRRAPQFDDPGLSGTTNFGFEIAEPLLRKRETSTVKEEVWISAVLVNDEDSTDKQMIDYFQKEGNMSATKARCYVKQRKDALEDPLGFSLRGCRA